MREWYYAIDGTEQGPITETDLVTMFKSGQLPPESMVWNQDMPDWAPAADQIEGLIADAAALTPIPPAHTMAMPTAAQEVLPPAGPAFLHISVSRLIVMSILSCGFYEIYWIYRNWRYLKERDGMKIRPFWRGWFGVFYCHSLLKAMHQDRELVQAEPAQFSAGTLATGWILLSGLATAVGREPGVWASILSFLIPTFLCFVPVQKYVNRVNASRNFNPKNTQWSLGHLVCLVCGLLIWGVTVLSIGADEF